VSGRSILLGVLTMRLTGRIENNQPSSDDSKDGLAIKRESILPAYHFTLSCANRAVDCLLMSACRLPPALSTVASTQAR